jgi:glucose-1-phosphatase
MLPRDSRVNWRLTKAIVLDLGNVVIPFDWQRGFQALSEHSPYPPEEVRRRIKETGLFKPFERGEMEPEDLARRIGDALDLNVSFEKFRELWSCIFLPETIVPEQMLARLRAAGLRLLLLSNTDVIHYRWVMEKYPIMRQFDDCVLSFELGFRKPEPEIYHETVRRAGCTPREIFFADDLAENVEGARQSGIDAVHFESLALLEQELRSRGVNY